MNMNGKRDLHQPSKQVIWAVTLGYNNADDTVECIHTLQKSEDVELHVVFVDNDSGDDSVARVMAEFPGVHVLQTGKNLGFSRGFNVGMEYCLQQGAELVFMVNNDTVMDPFCLARLAAASMEYPEAGILVPKIFYYDEPESVWAAGSRFRPFPPAIIMQKTPGNDDGRYDAIEELEFATTCALMLTRSFLEKVGMLDADYFIMYDDYDWSLRAREAGYSIRLVIDAKLWHKVSKSTGVGTRSPFFWTHYGKSTALFFRKHRQYRWMTGWPHLLYILLRMIVEKKTFGVKPFLKGFHEGWRQPLNAPPVPMRGRTDSYTRLR